MFSIVDCAFYRRCKFSLARSEKQTSNSSYSQRGRNQENSLEKESILLLRHSTTSTSQSLSTLPLYNTHSCARDIELIFQTIKMLEGSLVIKVVMDNLEQLLLLSSTI